MGLQNDSGTGFPSNSNNQASGNVGAGVLSFNRRSTVSLAGPFGELRLGRDYVPAFWNTAIFDPFGTGGGIGANQIYFSGLGGLVAPTGTRASNSIGYLLPASLGGFYGQVMYAMGENDSNSVLPGTRVSNEHDGDHTGARFGYQSGGLNIALATGRTRYASGDLRVTNLGASYTFDASLMNLKLTSELLQGVEGHDRCQGRAHRLAAAHRARRDQGLVCALPAGACRCSAEANLVEAGDRLCAQPVEAHRAVRDHRAHQQQQWCVASPFGRYHRAEPRLQRHRVRHAPHVLGARARHHSHIGRTGHAEQQHPQ